MKKEQIHHIKKVKPSISLRAINIFKHEPASTTPNAPASLNQENIETAHTAKLEAELMQSLAIYNAQKMNRIA